MLPSSCSLLSYPSQKYALSTLLHCQQVLYRHFFIISFFWKCPNPHHNIQSHSQIQYISFALVLFFLFLLNRGKGNHLTAHYALEKTESQIPQAELFFHRRSLNPSCLFFLSVCGTRSLKLPNPLLTAFRSSSSSSRNPRKTSQQVPQFPLRPRSRRPARPVIRPQRRHLQTQTLPTHPTRHPHPI